MQKIQLDQRDSAALKLLQECMYWNRAWGVLCSRTLLDWGMVSTSFDSRETSYKFGLEPRDMTPGKVLREYVNKYSK